ncbi:hypothetical protein SCP_1005590 [Sparassis crispa]|uniref:UBC core domain-containing protein n=1 Tax=Sparassis crispa TaxID=139825 RepID=A0A401GYS9_9APHY|nr:hypothetical protein SCP_1005590 [Sparassis crispa]GBE87311.1 hypothetical protein SCP_1005590 [Sparassis crispa]
MSSGADLAPGNNVIPRLPSRNVEVYTSENSVVAGFWQYGRVTWVTFFAWLTNVLCVPVDWAIFEYDLETRHAGEEKRSEDIIVQPGNYVLLAVGGELLPLNSLSSTQIPRRCGQAERRVPARKQLYTDGFLLRPCHGGEVGLDVNLVATKLQPNIERRKAIGEWDIDAFGASRTDRLDTREIEEAIVVALDVSHSMGEKFDGDSEDEDSDVDFDDIALNEAMEEFSKRHYRTSDALMQAKIFLKNMDCLASVARYICHGETTLHSGSGRQRRMRAEEVLKELVVIYSRMHWAQFRVMEPIRHFTLNLSRCEDFIAVATDNITKPQLVTYLVQQAAGIKEDVNLLASNGVPKRFIDPLSGEVMVNPVRASDGVIYERSRISAWLEHHSTSPMDPTVLINSTLVAVISLHNPIRTFLGGRPRASLQQHQQPLLIRVKTMWGSVLNFMFMPWVDGSWDGSMRGRRLETPFFFHNLPSQVQVFRSTEGRRFSLDVVELDHRVWRYMPDNADRVRKDSRSMSRLDIVKQAFEAFINKSEAFDHPIAIGLVTFGKEVREVQNLTLLKERFRDSLRTIRADGDTPLFDSLSVALSMLQTFQAEHPAAALRIICLTDGCDVGSSNLPHQITKKLQQSKVTVDSLVVQTGDLTNVLHPISIATGGYSFKIDTLENALNIVELETVLRTKDRLEHLQQPIVRTLWHLLEYNDLYKYPLDIVTADECPDRKPHARLHEPLLAASRAAARALPPSTDRQRRLMQELREVMNSSHPAIDVYSGSDLAFWKIVIEAPKGSPYEGGTFLAYVNFGSNYPQSAPEVRFITPILHPNINRHGKVCHAALDRSWVVDMTMKVILQVLYGILLTPDTDNPVRAAFYIVLVGCFDHAVLSGSIFMPRWSTMMIPVFTPRECMRWFRDTH